MVKKKASAKNSWLTKSTGNKKPIAKRSTDKKAAKKAVKKKASAKNSWLTKSTGNKKPIAKRSTVKKAAEKAVKEKASAENSWLTKSTGNKKPIAKKSTVKKAAEKKTRDEMSDKDYKFIVILLLVTFVAGLISGSGFTTSVMVAFVGTFSFIGAIFLAKIIFGDKEFGLGHYIVIAIIISISALILSSSSFSTGV